MNKGDIMNYALQCYNDADTIAFFNCQNTCVGLSGELVCDRLKQRIHWAESAKSKQHTHKSIWRKIYEKIHNLLQHALRICGLNELADNFKVE